MIRRVVLALLLLLPGGSGRREGNATSRASCSASTAWTRTSSQRFVAEGRMPNFERLMKEGDVFQAGNVDSAAEPGRVVELLDGHGSGRPRHLRLHPSRSENLPAGVLRRRRDRARSHPERRRLGAAPLQRRRAPASDRRNVLADPGSRRCPCTVIRVPANYPPVPTHAHTLSGMGTPDLIGSYGTFTLYTNAEFWQGAHASGGRIVTVDVRKSSRLRQRSPARRIRCARAGPISCASFCVDHRRGRTTARASQVGKEVRLLHAGEWSDWVHDRSSTPCRRSRSYPPCAASICAVYRPRSSSTCRRSTSIPEHPALPISTPANYARDLARRVGPYYTLGIAEDTKALEAGVFSDAEFVTQTDTLLAERGRMLDAVLDDYRGGLLFFYISTIDQSCHALWRNGDPAHPAHAQADTAFAGRFAVLYEDMDAMLGKVRARVGEDATIIVLLRPRFRALLQEGASQYVALPEWIPRTRAARRDRTASPVRTMCSGARLARMPRA